MIIVDVIMSFITFLEKETLKFFFNAINRIVIINTEDNIQE